MRTPRRSSTNQKAWGSCTPCQGPFMHAVLSSFADSLCTIISLPLPLSLTSLSLSTCGLHASPATPRWRCVRSRPPHGKLRVYPTPGRLALLLIKRKGFRKRRSNTMTARATTPTSTPPPRRPPLRKHRHRPLPTIYLRICRPCHPTSKLIPAENRTLSNTLRRSLPLNQHRTLPRRRHASESAEPCRPARPCQLGHRPPMPPRRLRPRLQ